MDRTGAILEITLDGNGGDLVWGGGPHGQLGPAFHDIAQDRENKLVIMTGSGDAFTEQIDAEILGERLPKNKVTPLIWGHIHAKRLLRNLLDIEVPIISAVNGPVTGQRLSAHEALQLGGSEIMPAARLTPRARELARPILNQPPLTVRSARVAMIRNLSNACWNISVMLGSPGPRRECARATWGKTVGSKEVLTRKQGALCFLPITSHKRNA
ncbi:hypothetical protein [Roseiarcus fermentans]|nr:hypothetical protein [Roseiarcus fermentans]